MGFWGFFSPQASLTFCGSSLIVPSSSMEPKNINTLNNNKQFFNNIFSTCTNHQTLFNITRRCPCIQNFKSITSFLTHQCPFITLSQKQHAYRRKLSSYCSLSMYATASVIFFYLSISVCVLFLFCKLAATLGLPSSLALRLYCSFEYH